MWMSEPVDPMLVHLYRGELNRSDTWRSRLDTTTNWALTTAAAVISFALSSREATHAIILAGGFLVLTFLVLEARRYRYYDLWIRRVRLLEDGLVAPVLRDDEPDREALRELASLMSRPRLDVSLLDAVGLRMRRTYGPIFLVLSAGWVFKIYEHPTHAESLAQAIERCRVGVIPATMVIALGTLVVLLLTALWVRSFRRPMPIGELRPRRQPRRPMAELFRLRRV
jgi:uncharacterized membrane protein